VIDRVRRRLNRRADRKTFSGYGGRSNPLALLVAPLAGIAFITAAAALAVSPAYLTISSSLTGRRKRDLLSLVDPQMADQITPELMQKIQELQVLDLPRFTRSGRAYRTPVTQVTWSSPGESRVIGSSHREVTAPVSYIRPVTGSSVTCQACGFLAG
jgi:hypothetical protein